MPRSACKAVHACTEYNSWTWFVCVQAMLRVAGAEYSQCVTLDQFMEVMRKTGKL